MLYLFIIYHYKFINMQMIAVEHPEIIVIITRVQLRTLTHLN